MSTSFSDAEWIALLRQELGRLVVRHEALRPGKIKAAGLCLFDHELGCGVVLAPSSGSEEPVLLEVAAAMVNAVVSLEPAGVPQDMAQQAETLLCTAVAIRRNSSPSLHQV